MNHDDSTTPPRDQLSGHLPVRMRGPADMAAMLPYLLGFYPDDSLVVVGLQGPSLQQGGVIRLDIPDDPSHWPFVASEAARLLVELSEERDRRPRAVLLYLCRDSGPGAGAVSAGLRPLAQHLLRAFRDLDLPVKESLCLSNGRWWSYLCADPACCDPAGTPVHAGGDPGAVVAAATFAGLAPRGSRKAIAAALTPVGPPTREAQRQALEQQTATLLATLARPSGLDQVLDSTGRLLDQAMAEFRAGALSLDDERAALLILGLQDKISRDRAAEYAEPDELACAQRLWRFLARRCVPPFEEYATAPLTLLAWTSWLAGDTATSRVVLAKALELDPRYTLARLLYHSLNGGLEPDRLLAAVRAERSRRRDREAVEPAPGEAARREVDAGRPGGASPAPLTSPADRRAAADAPPQPDPGSTSARDQPSHARGRYPDGPSRSGAAASSAPSADRDVPARRAGGRSSGFPDTSIGA